MTTYKEKRGTNIEVVATDPSNPIDGQVWYNSSSKVVKGHKVITENWATANSMNTARSQLGQAGVTTSAALAFAGQAGPTQSVTEAYNGTNWTEVNDMGTNRRMIGSANYAPQTAALGFGGFGPGTKDETEKWNGTNWTEVNNLNTARYNPKGAGTQTSALAFGGSQNPPPAQFQETESWNGTNWTEVNDLTRPAGPVGAGTGESNTAAIAFGKGPTGGNTELWNGTNWTEVNDLTTAREGLAGVGTSTLALGIGGVTPPGTTVTNVEKWNGTNWTEVTDLNAAQGNGAGAGLASAALGFAGTSPPPVTGATEVFTEGGTETVTFTDS